IEDVLTAIEQDRAPAITGEDGRRTIELITAIYLAGSTGRQVDLPLLPDNAFYTVSGILAGAPHFYEKTVSAAELTGDITLGSNYQKQ
ncbi:MAG: gfo/Idh/MocA family oxidoreductase, partial [Clostridia bacterium]|nr:gfo/Idh/MocA family oxidoreductase [Clostridia bacterium]